MGQHPDEGHQPHPDADPQKYHPDAWAVFRAIRTAMSINVCCRTSIGMEEGCIAPRHQPEIIARLYIGKMELVVDTELFPPGEFSFQHIHHEFIHYISEASPANAVLPISNKYKTNPMRSNLMIWFLLDWRLICQCPEMSLSLMKLEHMPCSTIPRCKPAS